MGMGGMMGGGQKGKGKGKKGKDREVPGNCKLWIGGVPGTATWKELEEHFKQQSTPIWCQVQRNGVACVAYSSPEEANMALSLYNGSEIHGSIIQVDNWSVNLNPEM